MTILVIAAFHDEAAIETADGNPVSIEMQFLGRDCENYYVVKQAIDFCLEETKFRCLHYLLVRPNETVAGFHDQMMEFDHQMKQHFIRLN